MLCTAKTMSRNRRQTPTVVPGPRRIHVPGHHFELGKSDPEALPLKSKGRPSLRSRRLQGGVSVDAVPVSADARFNSAFGRR